MMLLQTLSVVGRRMSRGQERRAAPRHAPAYRRVRLAWMEGARFHHARARLEDLSSGGALVTTQARLPERGAVWIGLEGTPIEQWTPAEVVRVETREADEWRAGLMFVGGCPGLFFRRALWGFVAGTTGGASHASARDAGDRASCWSARTAYSRGSILQGKDPSGSMFDSRLVARRLGF